MFCIQECKIQNLAREYCKIFSAEARVIENFGATLEWVQSVYSSSEVNILLSIICSTMAIKPHSQPRSFTSWRSLLHRVIPVYLMYRPANTVPYASVEADLTGVYQKYSVLDHTGRLDVRTGSEVEQKCCALQHWIFQWTNGNLLLTRLEGRLTLEFNREMSSLFFPHCNIWE